MTPPVSASGGPMSVERHHEIVQMLSETCIYSDNLARAYTRDVTDLLRELASCRAVLTQHEEALRFACRELAWERDEHQNVRVEDIPEADVDDTVAEFLEKARGFPAEGSVEVPE